MRILITGSRDWPDDLMIRRAITQCTETYARPGEPVIIVHGACPTGADALADRVAREFGYEVETYPADWEKQGKKAGFVRNAEMVDTAPDMCLAFIKDSSKGATMTRDLAIKAGIESVTREA